MKEIFNALEDLFVKFWNELYRFLCSLWGDEVNDDLLATTGEPLK
ncbi:MAG: hypothetical protein PUC33_03425 [Oscillospiraceae bacterium]|nr:hypothetical protein [Oscillospiraceae bacterium]MDD6146739.1 hypothetical protein [Oscillospiraceae bacterium]